MVTVPKAEDPKGWYPTVVLTEIVSVAGVIPEVAESAIHGWFFDAVQLTGPMLLRIRSVREQFVKDQRHPRTAGQDGRTPRSVLL